MDTSKLKDTQEDIEKICSDEYYKGYNDCLKGSGREPKSLDEKSCREKYLGLKELELEEEDIELRGNVWNICNAKYEFENTHFIREGLNKTRPKAYRCGSSVAL